MTMELDQLLLAMHSAPVLNVTDLRDIPGYRGIYAASRDGQIWAYRRAWLTARWVARAHSGMWLKTFANVNGYLRVNLNMDGQKTQHYVHRLVCAAWHGPAPVDKPQVNHLNSVKSDNRAENLEWCSASENKRHAYRAGTVVLSAAFYASVRRNILKAQAANKKRWSHG